MIHRASPFLPRPVVALFDGSHDTTETVRRMLDALGFNCVVGCRLADLKTGGVNFSHYLIANDPDIVLLDVCVPYAANWKFCQALVKCNAMFHRGVVFTTPDKKAFDEALDDHSTADGVLGKPYDLDQIVAAIRISLSASGNRKKRAD
jgi:DNA-binding response OmpR family regulator